MKRNSQRKWTHMNSVLVNGKHFFNSSTFWQLYLFTIAQKTYHHGCWLVCPLNCRENTRDAKPVRSYHVFSLVQVSSLPLFVSGAPVAVGMNIDIASIDMVSEVNMVRSADFYFWLKTSGEDAVGKGSLNGRAHGKM